MNCQWRVARRPDGNVRPEDFEYREEPIPAPGEGEFLRKTNSTMRFFFIYNYERDFNRGKRKIKNHGITICRVRRGPNDTEGLH